MGASHPQEGLSPVDCKTMANMGMGSMSYDAFGTACWSVYGMAIQLNPVINSIMEGAMITNVNFNAFTKPAVAKASPGSSNQGTAIYNPGV